MNKDDIKQIIRKEIVDAVLKTQDFLVVGNWKMHKTKQEVKSFLKEIADYDFGQKNTVVIVPPSPYLYLFEEKLRYSNVLYGVQNLYPKESGAYTGEVSVDMAKDFGCKYAIVGHSERRAIFGECNEFVSKKIRILIQQNITPILCIGENLEQRQHEDYKHFLVTQITEGLARITKEEISKVIIAYEPIWAIGTGETASPDQVEEIHVFIRDYLVKRYGHDIGKDIPLLYGGSVKPANVKELALAQSVSGFLIGGASLDAQTFIEVNNILNGK
mgnify:CR=1 FL=1